MKFTRIFAFMALAGFAGSALATNGYFAHGYGLKAKGMGGAATASHDSAFGGANNPASMAYAGDRFDLGADLFSPRREATRTGLGPFDGKADSDRRYFVIPEFGYNKMINNDMALGLSVYGNGGMNTNLETGQTDLGICQGGAPNGQPGNLLCGQGKLGVDLAQLVVAPTAAYKIAPNHSLGISPLLGLQRFKAKGLDAFKSFSSDPNSVTGRGYDYATGYGVRVGYMGIITPTVTVGAAYASKMRFQEFDQYRGLFAEQGDFDIPSNWNLGVSWQATSQFRFAFDYQRINYGGINSVNNASTNQAPFGANNGAGFGWSDIDVFKLGVEYQYSKALTLRAGWNHGENPISSRDVTFNIIAPGVVKDHVTLGLTHTLDSGNELTVAYMHAFSKSVNGASLLPTFGGGQAAGNEKIEMFQNSLGIQYSWKM